MNLPNKLTIFRVVLIPFFLVFLYTDFWGRGNLYTAAAIFIIASLTDLIDGKIARSKTDRTDAEKMFGVQIDSLCDVICFGVFPALICYYLGVRGVGGCAVMGYYCMCGVIRLAYFNSIFIFYI